MTTAMSGQWHTSPWSAVRCTALLPGTACGSECATGTSQPPMLACGRPVAALLACLWPYRAHACPTSAPSLDCMHMLNCMLSKSSLSLQHADRKSLIVAVPRAVYSTLTRYQHLVGVWRCSGNVVRSTLYEFHWEPDRIAGTVLTFDSMGCAPALPLTSSWGGLCFTENTRSPEVGLPAVSPTVADCLSQGPSTMCELLAEGSLVGLIRLQPLRAAFESVGPDARVLPELIRQHTLRAAGVYCTRPQLRIAVSRSRVGGGRRDCRLRGAGHGLRVQPAPSQIPARACPSPGSWCFLWVQHFILALCRAGVLCLCRWSNPHNLTSHVGQKIGRCTCVCCRAARQARWCWAPARRAASSTRC